MAKLGPYDAYGGLDLGATGDLTSFNLSWPVGSYVYTYPWFWIPADDLAERVRRDNVPYDAWSRAGYVELTPGLVTDWHYVTTRIKQLKKLFRIKEIGFDRAGARDTVSDLNDAGIETVDVNQGMMAMTAPAKYLEELVLSRHLVHTGHPILRWNLDCTTVQQDANGNIKPVKPNRLKGSKRIDGIVALIMAIARIQARPIKKPSVYNRRGLLGL